jgi:ATP-binding cassette subfamily C protein LapB
LEVLLTAILVNVLSLALPLALLQVYDRVIPNKSFGTITLLILGVGVAILVEAIMRFARAYLMSMIGARFEHQAGRTALRHLLGCDITAFEREGSGIHIERFNALNQLRDYYSGQAYIAIFDVPFIFLYVGMVFYFGGELGVILLALLLMYGLGVGVSGRRLALAVQRLQQVDDRRIDFIISTLMGIPTIKAQAMETVAARRYESFNLDSAIEGQRVNDRAGSLGDLGFFMTQIAIVATVGYGSLLVVNGQLSIGGLAACTLLTGRTMQPLNNIIGFWTRFQSVRSAKQRFEGIFSIPAGGHPVVDGDDVLEIDATTLGGSALELKDVNFTWPGSETPLLSDINLPIAAGEFIAITGPNGAGKSVLLTLMRGFAMPSSGQVLVDHTPLQEKSSQEIEDLIAYLPQHEVLFNGTILENLTTFRQQRDHQGVAAAELVGLSKWVQGLPDGFQTNVGGGTGGPLPRGIAQRIALARALVSNSGILLFDDANSAVDQVGDSIIKEVLAKMKGHTTVVVVSHRPSILDIADRIYHLSDGRLTEKSRPKSEAIEGSQ